MKRIFFIIPLFILFVNCDDSNSEIEGFLDVVKLRIQNASDFDFNNVKLDPATGEVSLGNIAKGQFSDYTKFQIAYRYAYVSVQIDGKEYVFQPIDYVGETPLTKGSYTYQIRVLETDVEPGALSIELIIDE